MVGGEPSGSASHTRFVPERRSPRCIGKPMLPIAISGNSPRNGVAYRLGDATGAMPPRCADHSLEQLQWRCPNNRTRASAKARNAACGGASERFGERRGACPMPLYVHCGIARRTAPSQNAHMPPSNDLVLFEREAIQAKWVLFYAFAVFARHFRFGSGTEVSGGHRNVRSWGVERTSWPWSPMSARSHKRTFESNVR